MTDSDLPIAQLAARQLEAYNAWDLDAFCACYHLEVRLLEGDEQTATGRTALRERYAEMFERRGFGARVAVRLARGGHCIDEEHWWREDPETGERSEGMVLVRYQLRDGLIGLVQFLD